MPSSDAAATADARSVLVQTATAARRWFRGTALLLLASIVLILVFAVILRDTGFLTFDNFMNVVRQTTMVSVMAVATVFVLSAGEIDLSFGATVALAALVGALVIREVGPVPAVLAALAVGGGVGLVNGLVAIRLGLPTFIVTLGMLGVVTGLGRWLTDLESVPVTNAGFNFWFGSGSLGPVSVLLFWTVAIVLLGHLALRHTAYGRRVLATGGNEIAARYSGIRTDRIKISVMVVSGIGAALAGLLYTGRLHGARYTLGESDLITVLAAVIIGGTALNGGRGTVIGAVIGSLLMGMINNALVLMGLSVAQQEIFRGLIIVVAVALSGQRLRLGQT
jgi:ribose transport system permease protein